MDISVINDDRFIHATVGRDVNLRLHFSVRNKSIPVAVGQAE